MRINKVWLVLGICLGVLLFTNCLKAEDIQGTVQGLINDGVPPEVVDGLFSGPSDTLGQRANDMLKAGTITQKQYDAVSNRFLSLPDKQRWAIKNAYTKGDAAKLYDATTRIAHQRLGDDASVRDHVKDLRQQGYTREQIKQRLSNEGIEPARIENIIASEPSRPGHLRDLREGGLSAEQVKGRVEPSHVKDKRDTIKGPTERRQGIRDKAHERPAVRSGAKESRDVRKDIRQQQDKGVRDRGKGAGRGDVGRGGERRR